MHAFLILCEELEVTPIGLKREEPIADMNDSVDQDHVVVPLIQRALVSAIGSRECG